MPRLPPESRVILVVAVLLALVLLGRVLVPAGYMPSASTGSTHM